MEGTTGTKRPAVADVATLCRLNTKRGAHEVLFILSKLVIIVSIVTRRHILICGINNCHVYRDYIGAGETISHRQ